MTRTIMLTATIGLALVTHDGAMAAGGLRHPAQETARQPAKTAQPAKPGVAKRDPPPDADQRARMSKVLDARKPRLAKAAAALKVTIDRDRAEFQQRKRAELEARNTKTRAEITRLAAQANTPAARAAARRFDIEREAEELFQRSKTASASEQAAIDQRAAELMQELKKP